MKTIEFRLQSRFGVLCWLCGVSLALALVSWDQGWNRWLFIAFMAIPAIGVPLMVVVQKRLVRLHCQCNRHIRSIWRQHAEEYKAWALAGPAANQDAAEFTLRSAGKMLEEFRVQLQRHYPVQAFGMVLYDSERGVFQSIGAPVGSLPPVGLPAVCQPGFDELALEAEFQSACPRGQARLVATIKELNRPLGLVYMDLEPGIVPDALVRDSFDLTVCRIAGMFHGVEVAGTLLLSQKELLARAEKIQVQHQMVSENNRWLQEIAIKDSLTGLANRRYLNHYLANECLHAQLTGLSLSVMLVDIDCFKQYNDTYGHLQGDQILVAVAGEIRKALTRRNDVVARYGGDEFMVVLPGASEELAAGVAERILTRIRQLNLPHAATIVPGGIQTVSIGVFSGQPCQLLPDKASTYKDVIEKTDQALYKAKNQGRNRYVMASP